MKFSHSLDSSIPRWFALYCRYRCEKKVQNQLERKGIQAYVPIQTLIRQYGNRKRQVEIPLISNYVFVKIIRSEYVPVLETDHVLSFLKFSNEIVPIPESEMETLKRIVGDAELEILAVSEQFVAGDHVEIVSGSLTGIQGILTEKHGKRHLKVTLQTIQYSLDIILDQTQVRKINSPLSS